MSAQSSLRRARSEPARGSSFRARLEHLLCLAVAALAFSPGAAAETDVRSFKLIGADI